MSPAEQKAAAASGAASLVRAGMTVGLGTGSTAALFVEALAVRRLDIRGVPTSDATAAQARALGIPIIELDDADPIDLTVDGADEIGPGLALIKGGGAALLREKLVWEASARCVVIADASKIGGRFGAFPLPIEVVAYGHRTTASRIDRVLRDRGLRASAVLRRVNGAPLRTDGGNLIYDVPCGAVDDPMSLASALKSLTGVVEHGLFLNLAERALVGTDDGVVTLHP